MLGPTVIRLSINKLQNDDMLQECVNKFDGLINSNILALMQAEEPIPQYIVRTLAEIFSVSEKFTSFLSQKFESAGLIEGLVRVLIHSYAHTSIYSYMHS